MRKLIASEYVSLDGVMSTPEEWTGEYRGPEEVMFTQEQLRAADALLLGRATYEIFAWAWPQRTDDHANRMNSLPKYVVSKTLKDLAWNNSHLITGNLAEEVARLKAQPGQDILLWGSGELVGGLMEHGLIDEYRLWIHPVVLGSGKRLFKEGGPMARFNLSGVRTFGSGVVIASYGPVSAG